MELFTHMNTYTLRDVFDACGGVSEMSPLLGISSRAVYKWLDKNTLPKTEYTGETNYSKLLADKNNQFSKSDILEIGRPQPIAQQTLQQSREATPA